MSRQTTALFAATALLIALVAPSSSAAGEVITFSYADGAGMRDLSALGGTVNPTLVKGVLVSIRKDGQCWLLNGTWGACLNSGPNLRARITGSTWAPDFRLPVPPTELTKRSYVLDVSGLATPNGTEVGRARVTVNVR